MNGEQTFHAEVAFGIYGSHEGFYGLGQHQAGVWNYRGETVDLSQENTEIAIPLLVSTNGYGIFWNNPSRSVVNNRFVHWLYMSGEVADRVDYYFIYGPDADQIIGHYRELTGEVPLFRALGLWLLAVQEQVPVAGGDRGRCGEVSCAAYSGGQHRAGLVLVDHDGRDEVELPTIPIRRA